MTDTAQFLRESRAAHRAGRAAIGKDADTVRAQFTIALEKRLAARASDPKRRDVAWLGDLHNIHKGVAWNGRATPERLAEMDHDLEAYYRAHLGESKNTTHQVDLNAQDVVLLPDEWRTKVEGAPPCSECGHAKAQHGPEALCMVRVFAPVEMGMTALSTCECPGYVGRCVHAWESTSPKTRRCVGCGEQQQLFEKLKREDSLAFQQLRREGETRES